MPNSVELRAQRANIWDRMQEIVDLAESQNRNLSTEEQANFDQANRDMDTLMERVQRMEALESTRAELATSQTSATGAPGDYGTIEETFSPAALKLIGDWILKHR